MSNDRYELNKNLAQMLKGGVMMDVTTPRTGKDCRKGRKNMLVTAFHPELNDDTSLHEYFLREFVK